MYKRQLYESVGGRLYTARDQFHLKKMLSGTHIYQKDEEPEQKLSSEPVTDSQSLKEQLELFAAPLSVMAKPVSYTHLDVYKRQI